MLILGAEPRYTPNPLALAVRDPKVAGMTRILFCWEMGKNYGHLSTMVPLVRRLKERGATIYMALQNPLALNDFMDDPDIHVLPAPFVRPGQPTSGKATSIYNYSDDIAPCGYSNPRELVSLLRSWYTIFDLVMPDVVLGDSAPTALMAARHNHIPTVCLGYGYNNPPIVHPMPALVPSPRITNDMLLASDKKLMDVVNDAMDIVHQPRIKTLSDMFKTDYVDLATLPELDHYGPRQNQVYSGPMFLNDSGLEAVWPDIAGPKIFAYIRPEHPLFIPTLHALKSLPYPALVVAPKCPDRIIHDLSAPNLKVQREPVRFAKMLPQTEIVINHASHSTAAAAFLAGCTQLLLPGQIEQLMFGQQLIKSGSSILVHLHAKTPEITGAIKKLIDDPRYKTAAQAMRQKYISYNPQVQADKLADTVFDMATKTDFVPQRNI